MNMCEVQIAPKPSSAILITLSAVNHGSEANRLEHELLGVAVLDRSLPIQGFLLVAVQVKEIGAPRCLLFRVLVEVELVVVIKVSAKFNSSGASSCTRACRGGSR